MDTLWCVHTQESQAAAPTSELKCCSTDGPTGIVPTGKRPDMEECELHNITHIRFKKAKLRYDGKSEEQYPLGRSEGEEVRRG